MKNAVSLLVLALAPAAAVASTPEAVLYRGTLLDGGQSAPDGTYRVKYSLYVSAADANAVASVGAHDLVVTGGQFTDDIGGMFLSSMADAWLEMSVAPPGTSTFDTLPRVRITAMPYANRAAVAELAEHVDWSGVANAPVPLQGVPGPTGATGSTGTPLDPATITAVGTLTSLTVSGPTSTALVNNLKTLRAQASCSGACSVPIASAGSRGTLSLVDESKFLISAGSGGGPEFVYSINGGGRTTGYLASMNPCATPTPACSTMANTSVFSSCCVIDLGAAPGNRILRDVRVTFGVMTTPEFAEVVLVQTGANVSPHPWAGYVVSNVNQ